MRRLGSIVFFSCLVSACGSRSGAPQPLEAGVAPTPVEEARAARRRLRDTFTLEWPKPAPSPARAPFAVANASTSFDPTPKPATPPLALPNAPATVASSFTVETPITPMPDRSGRYVLRRADTSTFFTSSGLSFALSSGAKRWGVHCALVGARDGGLVAEREQSARAHAHHAGLSRIDGAPTYARLAWEDIYPGVDMIVEPARGGVAYRFILSPGAKVSDLLMRWNGATELRAVDGGLGLDVETGIGVLRVRGLRAFTMDGEVRRSVPARYVVRGRDLAFEVDGWDGRSPLVIDPVISWSSYLGGAGSDNAKSIAVDRSGSVFVAGQTDSADFPSTGGFDTTRSGTTDAFVAKMSASGALLWSSYLGGSGNDYGEAIAVDGNGDAFVTGWAMSTDFPTNGGFDTTRGGTQDAFVAKVSATGALLWSSFLGGESEDFGYAIAVDGSGSAVVTGSTTSAEFPTSGAFDTSFNGAQDVFVTKVSGSGALLWSAFLGGASGEEGHAIAVDGNGDIFVAGETRSGDFPSSGGFDTTLGGAAFSTYDAFVTKVSASGVLVWSSFLGGSENDHAHGIAVDGSGNAFVTGVTYSADFPSAGGFDTTLGGPFDAFVTKVSGTGARLWSSLLGGGSLDFGRGVAVDGSGNAVITGYTNSPDDFPKSGGFDTTLNGSWDAFVTKVSGAGTVVWSSFLGGISIDAGHAIAIDGSGNIVVAGMTQSINFPSGGGFDASISGGGLSADAFVTRVQPVASTNGAPCAYGGACASGFCVDGVCCDTACTRACEACTASKKGFGGDGACGPIANGSDPDQECAAQSCSSGVVAKPRVCDGNGACRADGTVFCGLHACAGTICGTSCSDDSGCMPAAFCAGTACVADLDQGAPCSRASQCKTGLCVDGVCCDKPCAGGCEACTAAKKGAGVDGSCGVVAADTDPKDACPLATSACGADGLCDGAGSCRSFAKPGTACGATTCVNGTVSGRICKGDSDTCGDGKSVKCAPYACGTTACKTLCASDSDCGSDAFCSTPGACTPKAVNGPACTIDRECRSGHCAEGVCCNDACGGQCESCVEPGTEGTCTIVSGKPRGARAACDALADDDCAKTTCDGAQRDSCAGYANGATTACGENTCTLDKKFQKKGRCDGAGACARRAPIPCTPYVCDLAASTGCKSTCKADADCTDGFTCSEGACVQQGATCSGDQSASIDKLGRATPCTPYRCGASGQCDKECSSSAECAASHVCDVGTRSCVAATTSVTDEGGGCSCETGPRPSSASDRTGPRERNGAGVPRGAFAFFALAACALIARTSRSSRRGSQS